MFELEIPDLKDILQGDLLERSDWLVANLETTLSWPVSTQKIEFRGRVFWLLPVTRQSYPAIAMKLGGSSREEGQRCLLRLVSAISWNQGSGIMVVGFGGGTLPRPLGREKARGLVITADLDLSGLPEPSSEEAQLALALMREGRGLNHPGYAFLSYYRVLEVCFPNGLKRKKWLAAHVDGIRDPEAKKAIEKLKLANVSDVGEHLYRSGRQAIAHAAEKPIIDPDEPSDSRRLRSELPIIRSLAETAIETELGVNTSHTEWEQHLYELAGFKRILGDTLLKQIADGGMPEDGQTIDLPVIDVELRRRAPYLPLQKLQPIHAAGIDGMLQLVFGSDDGLVRIQFTLDFKEERLRFDFKNGIFTGDDGSALAATNAAEITRFVLEYIGNGQLQIYDSETRELISRVDAFVPVNFWANHDWFESQIAKWETEAKKRADIKGET